MKEEDYRRLLGTTLKWLAAGAILLGVVAIAWPRFALGALVGLALGSIDLVGLGLRLPLLAKSSRMLAVFLVNARFFFRVAILGLVLYFLGKWAGTGVLLGVAVGVLLPYLAFGLGAWSASRKE